MRVNLRVIVNVTIRLARDQDQAIVRVDCFVRLYGNELLLILVC